MTHLPSGNRFLLPPRRKEQSQPQTRCQVKLRKVPNEVARYISAATAYPHMSLEACEIIVEYSGKNWLGWLDSNQRMPIPKTGALPLGYTPRPWRRYIARSFQKRKPSLTQSFLQPQELSPGPAAGFDKVIYQLIIAPCSGRRSNRSLIVRRGYPSGVAGGFKKVMCGPANLLRDQMSFAK